MNMTRTWNAQTPPEDVPEDVPGPGNVLMYVPVVLRWRGEWRVGEYTGDGGFSGLASYGSMAEAMADWKRRDENAELGKNDWASPEF